MQRCTLLAILNPTPTTNSTSPAVTPLPLSPTRSLLTSHACTLPASQPPNRRDVSDSASFTAAAVGSSFAAEDGDAPGAVGRRCNAAGVVGAAVGGLLLDSQGCRGGGPKVSTSGSSWVPPSMHARRTYAAISITESIRM